MQCEEFITLLDDWKDGVLSPEKQQEMELHLKNCSRCQILAQMQKDLTALAIEAEMPPSFSESWRTAIRKEKHSSFRRWQNIGAAAAALILTVGGSLYTANALIPHQQAGVLTQETDNAIMMARAMPAPEPTLWEKTLTTMGNIWPGLVLLLAGMLFFLFIIKRHKR